MANRRTIALAAALLAGVLLPSCAPKPDTLAPIRQRVAAAAADPDTRSYAAGSLADAKRMLDMAAAAGSGPEADHFIYMTEKNLDIAAAIVDRHRAERELAALRLQPQREPPREPGQAQGGGAVTAEPLDPPRPPAEPSRNIALTIPDLSFGSGTAALSPGAKRRLDPIVASLRADPALSALIEGYTDDSGGREANLRISLDRAKAVKDYLIEQGIAAERIQTLGHGEKFPIASNDTPEGRSQNRRIEIVVHRIEPPAKQDARRP